MADRDELKADVIAAMNAAVCGALDTGSLIDIERTALNIANKYAPTQPVATQEDAGKVQAVYSDDLVPVPRGLIGAACAALNRGKCAPATLTELRRYTVGDLSASQPSNAETNLVDLHHLKDPAVVQVNMLAGNIAKPSMRECAHLHGESMMERWNAFEEWERSQSAATVPQVVQAPTKAMLVSIAQHWGRTITPEDEAMFDKLLLSVAVPTAKEFTESNQLAVTKDWMLGWNDCRATLITTTANAGKEALND